MSMDEAQCIALARDGDRLAFRRLVDRHARPLFAVCARITRDAAVAEDAVQEALFSAYRHLRDFDQRASFSTWLHRIAVNSALQQLRRRERHEQPLSELDEGAQAQIEPAHDDPTPDRRMHSHEIGRAIEGELQRMTALERTAFVLRHQEGHSLEEISETLSLSLSASKQAVFRAVRKLRGALAPHGITP